MILRLGNIDLAGQVLVGFMAGLAVGIFFGELTAPLSILGTAFIRLLQITVIPYIMVALITGLGRLELAEIGRLARSGGGVLILLWAFGILLVLSMPLGYPDWPQRSLFQKSSVQPGVPVDFLLLFIPSNPFHAMANAIVPAIVVFSILVGLALTTTPHREKIVEPLVVLGDALAKITSLISRLSPVGVFALVAGLTGTIAADDLLRLQVHIFVFTMVVLVTVLWLVPAIVASVTPVGHRELLRELRAPIVTAFATGSSLVVLPMLAEACKRLIDQHTTTKPSDEQETEVRSSVDILIPTFFSFPTIGNILALGFVVFGGWYVGSPLGASQYVTLVIGGIASLFGGTAIAIPFALDLVGLPAKLFNVFISVDFIGVRLVTILSVMHYAAIALIGTFALQRRIRFRSATVLQSLIPGIVVVLAILLSLRFVYTNYIVVPYTADKVLEQARLIGSERDTVVHLEQPDEPAPGAPRTFSEIVKSGTFRACYLPGNYPLSFLNKNGELVGFDIEMAHRFARSAGLSLVLKPLDGLSNVADRLNAGYCDAVFNSTTLVLDRIGRISQTAQISLGTLAVVVPETRRKLFRNWQAIREMRPLRMAHGAYNILPRIAETRASGIEFIPLTTFDAQRAFFESDGSGADAFIDTAEEGAAWTVLFPRFAVVVPEPVTRVPLVYLTARDNPQVLKALNTWLSLEREAGGIKELETYWIEGNRDAVARPRWSVIRNILGWISYR